MQNHEHRYRGLMTELWDFLRGDTSLWADREFYLACIHRIWSTGLRHRMWNRSFTTRFSASWGRYIWVDDSPEMLSICRHKANELGLLPTLYQQAMQQLSLPQMYRTILVPSSSFQLVTEPTQAEHTMRLFYDHLEPHGALVASFRVPWTPGQPIDTGWELSRERYQDDKNIIARRWTRKAF